MMNEEICRASIDELVTADQLLFSNFEKVSTSPLIVPLFCKSMLPKLMNSHFVQYKVRFAMIMYRVSPTCECHATSKVMTG